MRTTIGQTISFLQDGRGADARIYGWAEQEPLHVWSVGSRSALCINAPVAPLGYFLEIHWLPFVFPPWIASQALTIRINDVRVFTGDIQFDEVAAFRCPAPKQNEDRLLITFEHPNPGRPTDFGQADDRELAIAFRRVRVLPLVEPSPGGERRRSHHRLHAADRKDLAAATEKLAGIPIANLLTGFEMLAGNCDMGTVQRAFSLEPLSLLRFAGSYPAVSILGLDTGFDGIGQDLEPWVGNGEWMMRDQYGMNYHTMQRVADVAADQLVLMERKRISFLLRKFLEDLAEGEKIFVADRTAGSFLHGILPLFLALNRHGPRSLLWVVTTPRHQDWGAVQEVLPGLFIGYLSQFSAPMIDHVSLGGWLEVMLNAWVLIKGVPC